MGCRQTPEGCERYSAATKLRPTNDKRRAGRCMRAPSVQDWVEASKRSDLSPADLFRRRCRGAANARAAITRGCLEGGQGVGRLLAQFT